jgi:TRAP-type mannitol/chloroaromatic compound transport system permease small subunit
MIAVLKFIIQIANAVNEWVGKTASWLTLFLVLLVCLDVGRRYILNSASVWGMELEWHLFAAVFLLGAGYAFKHDRHVRVDLFYANFSERDKAWTNLVGGIIFLIPWCILIIVASYSYAKGSFEIMEESPNPDGLPFRFIIKFAVTFGIGLLLLQGIANVSESLLVLIEKPKPQEQD